MKIFKAVQRNLSILGFNAHESQQCNWKILAGVSLFVLIIFLNVLYITSLDDVVLMDYVEFFCMISALFEIGICWANIAMQQSKLFEIAESFETLVNGRNLFAFPF